MANFQEQRDLLREINAEYGKQNTALQDARKAMTELDSVATKLRNNEEEISDLTNKQVIALEEKAKAALRELEIAGKRVKFTKATTDEQKALKKAAQDNFNIEKALLNDVTKEVKLRKDINKKLGVTGGLLKGISKIPILGDIIDTKSTLKDMEGNIRGGGNALTALGAGFKNLGGQAITGLLNPANLALGAITFLVEAISGADKATGELAKSMNLSYNEALGIRQEFTSIAAQSLDSSLNTERLQETLSFVNKELGTSGRMSEDNLKTFTKLREQAGMTNEEIMSMQKFSMVMGGDLEDNVVNFQAQAKALSVSKGTSINVKQLMGDMTKVSNRTKMSIEGGAEGLAKAAVNAKLMGGNLDQVASIADSLLNFEQSIEKELSAELLLGKDINLEKARTAALNNDMATVAAEITKQAGTAAEFGEMNRIQQEAIAAAMGMSADQMADMLFEQEALKSIGTDLNDEQQKAFDLAKEKYGVEEASRMLASDAAGEGIDGLVDQQAAQEEFNDSVEKFKEIFVDIAQNILPAIKMALEPIGIIMQGIGFFIGLVVKGFKTLLPIIITVGAALAVVYAKQVGMAIMNAVSSIYKALGGLPVVGPVLALAAIGGAVSFINSKKVNDGIIQPDGGIALSTQKGTIQLNKEDSVVAGTNLFGEKGGGSGGGSTSGGGANMSQTNALLQQLINVISAGGDVTLDGQKVGEALNLVSYKIQ